MFHGAGRIAALLTPIEKSAVDDPEDYRVAWQLWQEVLPVRQKLIDRAFAGLAQNNSVESRENPVFQGKSGARSFVSART